METRTDPSERIFARFTHHDITEALAAALAKKHPNISTRFLTMVDFSVRQKGDGAGVEVTGATLEAYCEVQPPPTDIAAPSGERCFNCGHPRAEHTGGSGHCTNDHNCPCKEYLDRAGRPSKPDTEPVNVTAQCVCGHSASAHYPEGGGIVCEGHTDSRGHHLCNCKGFEQRDTNPGGD